jgi:predicted  nucleic acid-binding Zn-ribbon protein
VINVWWLLKLLLVGPPSKGVETSLRRQLEDLREDVSRWEQKQATLAGQLLTQTRRVTRLESEIIDPDGEEDETETEFQKLLNEKRGTRG